MDPDEFLAHHISRYHTRQAGRLLMLRFFFALLFFAVVIMVFIAFR
jgi:hypothetical protein